MVLNRKSGLADGGTMRCVHSSLGGTGCSDNSSIFGDVVWDRGDTLVKSRDLSAGQSKTRDLI